MVTLLEWIGGSAVYSVLKDSMSFVKRRLLGPSASEKLERRAKWKPIFEELILERRRSKLRSDVIIRDIRRLDQYPDTTDKKGISAWFRVGLADTYHRGIQVALGIHSLVWEESERSYRLADWDQGEEATINGYLVGFIPYEAIEHVDPNGDEYYSYPHIYCNFQYARQPYERLAFCERRELTPDREFYTELQDVEGVRLTSQKFGTAKWCWTS